MGRGAGTEAAGQTSRVGEEGAATRNADLATVTAFVGKEAGLSKGDAKVTRFSIKSSS